MKLKLNEQGFAVVQDGKPVYVDDSGTEIPFDAPAAMAKITALNGESKAHRLKAEEAATALKAFEGIADPAAAVKALQFAQSMEGKKAMDDESIKAVVASAVKPLQDQLAERDKTIADKDGTIYKLEVGNRFATSKFLTGKTLLTPDAAEALFGKHFKVENGKAIPSDAAGNPIYTKDPNKYGEPADFDEALEILYEAYPHKENYRKGSGHSGSGTPPGGGGKPGSKSLNRAAFEALGPAERAAHFKDGGTVTD